MAKPVMVRYHNPNELPIVVKIGNAPGEAPTVYSVGGGSDVEGPAAYEAVFRRAGLVLASEVTVPKAAPPKEAPEKQKPEPEPPKEAPPAPKSDTPKSDTPKSDPDKTERRNPFTGEVVAAEQPRGVTIPVSEDPAAKGRRKPPG